MALKYLLDTHALVFYGTAPEQLGAKARRVLFSASPGEVGIPAASLMELGWLIHLEKVEFDGRPSDVLAKVLRDCPQVPVSLDAAIAAPALRLAQKDPYDRLIVATARELGVPLITKDANIADSGLVSVIW